MNQSEVTVTSPQREAILARFTSWLDEALGDEGPLPGIAAELVRDDGQGDPAARVRAECDLFSLFSALTALTQEVKLQGRTFHELRESVGGLPASVESLRAASERVLGAERAAREERAFAPVLDLLLDLRERLRRGRDAAREHVARLEAAPRPGVIARLLGGSPASASEAERAFVRGYELALERLDEALKERGIVEIACEGRAFDPHTMKAVEVVETASAAADTVVAVHRSGYLRNGELLRAAEVKVARERRGT